MSGDLWISFECHPDLLFAGALIAFICHALVGLFNAANWFNNPIQSALSAILLLEHPGFHDILILYLVPMIFLPLAIVALKQGKLMYVVTVSF
ncbi:hypothetical protein AC626_05665 [Pseudoalteromonas rubra]|uniref:Uncharacterized protein n=1 Tax=Pseudoalteromonas rubra TaxID=43658 RepID=A0A0L0EV52_9GAMM|nr:hypothetical protein AC626_05665 [Pseudoalteromonas rubra]